MGQSTFVLSGRNAKTSVVHRRCAPTTSTKRPPRGSSSRSGVNMVMRVINSTSESEVMTPMTRSDETVDIGPIKGAGGSRSHVQVRILPTMGRHIQAHC